MPDWFQKILRFGFDSFETFSLVVKPITLRIFSTLALTHKWSIFQFKVNNAFLSRLTSTEILHVSTLRFEAVDKSLGCRFNKAIYVRVPFFSLAVLTPNVSLHYLYIVVPLLSSSCVTKRLIQGSKIP